MENNTQVVTNEETTNNVSVETKEEKTFTSADLDRARTEASITARNNAEKELREKIRKELEEEAKLTAEEKARKDFENELNKLKEEKLELNKDRARVILKEAGFDLENSKDLINSIVSDDKEDTIKKANLLATQFKLNLEALRKSDREQMVKNTETPKVSKTQGKEWKDMSYEERLNLKEKNPTLYKEYLDKYSKNY